MDDGGSSWFKAGRSCQGRRVNPGQTIKLPGGSQRRSGSKEVVSFVGSVESSGRGERREWQNRHSASRRAGRRGRCGFWQQLTLISGDFSLEDIMMILVFRRTRDRCFAGRGRGVKLSVRKRGKDAEVDVDVEVNKLSRGTTTDPRTWDSQRNARYNLWIVSTFKRPLFGPFTFRVEARCPSGPRQVPTQCKDATCLMPLILDRQYTVRAPS